MEATESFPYTVVPEGKYTHIDKDNCYLQLRLHLTPTSDRKIATINHNQHILIVLDKSGSMSGAPINNSKTGIEEMVKFFRASQLNNITLITYDSAAQKTDFLGLSPEEQSAIIGKIQGNGGTSFKAAFDRIMESVKERNSKDVKVIFFTDGEDSSAKGHTQSLKKFFQEVPQSEFHTIGFRENHDVDLLSTITTLGSKPGTFQYCKESTDIQTCVESIAGLIACASFVNGSLLGPKGETALDFDLCSDEEAKVKEYKTTLFVNAKENDGRLKIKLTAGKAEHILNINLADLAKDDESSTEPIFLRLYFVKHRIGECLQRALGLRNEKGEVNKELCSQLVREVEDYNSQLDEMSDYANKMKVKGKKEFFPQLLETKELVTEFYAKLKDFQSGQLNNDKVAALNALAYRKVTKKGLQRKLDARTTNNIGVINKAYDVVKEATSKMNFNELQEKYGTLAARIGECVFSAANFIEALKEDDCLCLTYDVGRSQAAIMDPTQIVIKDVFPTYITVSSFMFSAEYALKANSEAHGGFSKSAQGEIVKGVARESITGVLPLYICPEHWTVSKQLMKPALGWTVTLDPLGYSFSQVKTVPFMVLCKLYNMPPSEFVDFQIKLVEETCMEIIKDASNPKNEIRLNEEVTKLFEGYLKDPLVRTIDSIANNQVFVLQLYLMAKLDMIKLPGKEHMEAFFQAVCEEEMRRCTLQYEPTVTDVNERLLRVLNCDIDREIVKPVNDHIAQATGGAKKVTGYAAKFLAALGKDHVEEIKAQGQKPEVPKHEEEKIVYDLNTHGVYNNSQLAAMKELEESRNRANRVVSLKRLFGLPLSHDNHELNPENQWTLIALYCQNKLTAKNADRREYISSGQYKNPFEKGREYVEFLHEKLVEKEKANRITQALADVKTGAFTDAANAFHSTEDVYEAAGAMMGVRIGDGITYFWEALCRPGAPLLREKIEMLQGKFKGVSLLADRGGSMMWDFGKRRANGILRANADRFDIIDWGKILPMISPSFLERFLAGKCV